MAIQTSVSSRPAIGFAGQLAEPGAPSYRVSGVISGSLSNAVAPGKLLVRGTSDGQVTAVQISSSLNPATVVGVCMYESSRAPDSFNEYSQVTAIRKGVFYAVAAENVTDGAIVTYGSGGPTLDKWGVTTGADYQTLTFARWADTVDSGSIGRIEFDAFAATKVSGSV